MSRQNLVVLGPFAIEVEQLGVCDFPRITLLLHFKPSGFARLADSLSLSRHGKSSGERCSVMILDPMSGNILVKAPVSLGHIKSHG